MESLAFTRYGTMLASFNVDNTGDYETAYQENNNKKPPADGVFKIKHGNNQNFS